MVQIEVRPMAEMTPAELEALGIILPPIEDELPRNCQLRRRSLLKHSNRLARANSRPLKLNVRPSRR
jgi:hypothetical protein